MAGLKWFELDTDFHDDPKVMELCSRLRNPLADSYVSRLYAYCYKHLTDRFPPTSAADTIEAAVRWKGRRGVLLDALHGAGILEREAGYVVVHGVAKRLGPHLAKRDADAERQARHRDKVSASIRRNASVTRDVTRDSQRNQTEPNQDQTRPPIVSETDSRSETDPRLAGLCERLAREFDRESPLGIGKDPSRVEASFRRWLDTVGEDETVAECVRLAREKGVTPSNLSWWPGWLDTVSDADLRRPA